MGWLNNYNAAMSGITNNTSINADKSTAIIQEMVKTIKSNSKLTYAQLLDIEQKITELKANGILTRDPNTLGLTENDMDKFKTRVLEFVNLKNAADKQQKECMFAEIKANIWLQN